MTNSFLSSCTSGGCGAKIGPDDLSSILNKLPVFASSQLLVGFDTSDDAAVYKMNDQQAIVSTVDFFSPMVEDPYLFGKIAAANALSDVYAMGGEMLFALNLVCFPEKMDKAILGQMLQGGAQKVKEAGALLCGGHSIYDKEPKYGLAVTGCVHPDKIWRNNTCEVGDVLVLTKPLGVGIVMAALRGELASEAAVAQATASMERLNKYAADCFRKVDIHACTDVTGFGLLAHACEMADDQVSIEIDPNSLPFIPEAYEYANEYLLTAAAQRNRNHLSGKVDVSSVEFARQELMFDPQTSGGLLVSLAQDQLDLIWKELTSVQPMARVIGRVVEKQEKAISFCE